MGLRSGRRVLQQLWWSAAVRVSIRGDGDGVTRCAAITHTGPVNAGERLMSRNYVAWRGHSA